MDPTNIYFLIILVTVVGLFHLDLFAELLNLKALRDDLPKEFDDVFSKEDYAKSQEYTRVKTRFGIIEATFSLAVFLLFWWIGGFQWLDSIVRGMAEAEVARGLIYICILYVANLLLSIPFEVYGTFVLEERFGFNKTTPKTFVLDQVKALIAGNCCK